MTGSVAANVIRRAGVAVVTGIEIVFVHADAVMAGIGRAYVVIVALIILRAFRAMGHGSSGAKSITAHIAIRTRVAVVACRGIIGMDAACLRIAGVVGASIAVVAAYRGPAAGSIATNIMVRARIAVVAHYIVVGMSASASRIAAVRRANVAVIAVQSRAAKASSAGTRVVGRAGAAVIA